MRVLVVHNRYRSSQPSGENTVVEDEAALLAENGVDVRRLTVSSDEIAHWRAPARAALGARVVWSAQGYRSLRDAIVREDPDVVHVHNTFPLLSPSAFWAARRSGVPVVQTLHNFRPLCPSGMLFRDGHVCEDCVGRLPLPAVRHRCYRSSRLATLPVAAMDALHAGAGTWRRCVDRFLTPSEFARGRYLAAGWPAEQMTVKYNTTRAPGGPREGAGGPFACVARLEEEKGIDVLLDAWEEAFPEGGQELLVVGSGDAEDAYRSRAAARPDVRFLGRVQPHEALGVMRSARAVVVPSVWYEVFPRTVVEAYALGVPVVASALGSLGELVQDGRTGLTFAAGSAPALASALRRLAGDAELAVRLGRGARSAYEARYSPEATTARLRQIYAEVSEARAAQRAPAAAATGVAG